MISERDIVYVTKKQASIATAMLVLLCMLIFVLGYFWGKRSVTDGFGQKVAQDSAQDRVDYLSTMQTFMEKTKQDIQPVESGVAQGVIEQEPDQQYVVDQTEDLHKDKQGTLPQEETFDKQIAQKKSFKKMHHATLIGFGTRAAAQSFVNRLKKHNITVEIKSRVSKTASGKVTRTWYQVVTKPYESKEQLQELVDKIKKLERIKDHDIKIK